MELLPTDIIPPINKDCVNSFADVESNRTVIAERGWFPYNRNHLMHKQLCNTMTMKYIETEKKRRLVLSTFIESTYSIESIHSNASSSLKENDRLQITQSKSPFNHRFRDSKLCLET